MKRITLNFVRTGAFAVAALSLANVSAAQSQPSAPDPSQPPAQQDSQPTTAANEQSPDVQQGTAADQASTPDATASRSDTSATADSARVSDQTTPSREPASAASASGDSIRVATKDETEPTASKFAGKKLQGPEGRDVGTIKDFLVDSRTGQIRFAVVGTGGFLRLGEKLHLVPFEQLKVVEDGDAFSTAMTKEQVEQTPTVEKDALKQPAVAMSQQNVQPLNAGDSQSEQLIQATKIDGREITTNGKKIAEIEAVVIRPSEGKAMALVEADDQESDTDRKFLVPLSRFSLSDDDAQTLTTSLTRSDFELAIGAGTASASATGSNTPLNTSTTAVTGATDPAPAAPAAPAGLTAVASNSPSPTGGSARHGTDAVITPTDEREPLTTNNAVEYRGGDATITAGPVQSPIDTARGDADAATDAKNRIAAQSNADATADGAGNASSDAESAADAPAAATSSNEMLTPTGQTSADQTPSGSSTAITAAQKVRAALDADETLAAEEVRVLPRNDGIILHGSVSSQDAKSRIEAKAKSEAGHVSVDSQLEVKSR